MSVIINSPWILRLVYAYTYMKLMGLICFSSPGSFVVSQCIHS